MPLMQWSDKYSVGVNSIDDQHKELVRMLNDLSDAMMGGRGNDELGKVLDSLIAYTVSHFAHEEQQMDRFQYPEAAQHKKQHADLKTQAIEIQQKFKSGATATISFEVLGFLKNWLINHIQGSDKKLGLFLSEQKQARVR